MTAFTADAWRLLRRLMPAWLRLPRVDPGIPALAATPPLEADLEGQVGVYHSVQPEPGETTTAFGRHSVDRLTVKPVDQDRTRNLGPYIATAVVRDVSMFEATQAFPVLERNLWALGLPEEPAALFWQLARQWPSGLVAVEVQVADAGGGS